MGSIDSICFSLCILMVVLCSSLSLPRPMLLPVMSSHSRWVSIMVYWSLEPLHYSIPARRRQGWHQGEKWQKIWYIISNLQLIPPQDVLLVSLSQEMIRSNFTVVVCCDTLGPRSEGGMGGPSRVGEGHPALAVCPAGPGKAVPPSTPQHRLQQPWSALWGEASQGDSTQLHGIWPTGKHFTHFLIILASVGQKYKLVIYFKTKQLLQE